MKHKLTELDIWAYCPSGLEGFGRKEKQMSKVQRGVIKMTKKERDKQVANIRK